MNSLQDFGPILGVAIEYDGVAYRLPAPNRHHDVIRAIWEKTGKGIAGPDIQGFYSSTQTFMTRELALEVALACNQVANPENIMADKLFSEDLW